LSYLLLTNFTASAPVFAALVSLLNDQRLQANKPSLGFM
jgi:hypothetical protein